MDWLGKFAGSAGLLVLGVCGAAADGIAHKIVSSPLSASGTVRDAPIGINVLLQSDAHPGSAFMDPRVVGYGVPAGGRVEIEMLEGYERVPDIALTQKVMMVLSGTPHQPMPGKAVGYAVGEGENPNTIVLTPTNPDGLPAETLMSPAPGAKGDPIRQRGIKVFHLGLLQYPFINRGAKGTVEVRFVDGSGKVVHSGRETVEFLDAPVPQIQPSNFPDNHKSHNWQTTRAGETLGKTPGTLPISYSVYKAPKDMPPSEMGAFKGGETGVGVLSTRQLAAMDYTLPTEISRYSGGLIVKDTNGDGRLDPKADQIVGGVIGKAPPGATGQELRSLDEHGAPSLTVPLSAYNAKFGKLFGGAVGLLQFTAGDKPGPYEPTLALLKNPGDPASGDGSSYMFTIVVE